MTHETDYDSSRRSHVPPRPGAAPSAGNTTPGGAGVEGMAQILKRETHSSRAVASIAAAILVVALCVYALLETAVRAVGQPPWLVDPETAAEQVVALPNTVQPLLLGVVGAVLVMAGLFFLLNALLPGRRARHLLRDRRAAVVVDDEVIASTLARRARVAANVSPEQVMVTVSRQQVQVNVRPTSGVPLNQEVVLKAVQDELRDLGLYPPTPEVRINVASTGVVGA